MAVKKIRMRPEGVNDYGDILHPETSADQVIASDGVTTFESHLADKATQVEYGHTRLQDIFVVGTYSGNDAPTRTISLGFRPSAVLLFPSSPELKYGANLAQGGLALDGFDMVHVGNAGITIVSDGFVVYNVATYIGTNRTLGNTFRYIAFK